MTHASPSAGLPGLALAPIHPLHPRRWTPLRIAAFLTMLDASGSAYRLRARHPAFAAAWNLAERVGRGLPPPRAGVTQGDTP